MHNDNLYINDGHYFLPSIPKAQQEAKQQELSEILAQVPILKQRIEYLDKKIAFYGDVDSIPVDLDKDPIGHRNLMAVNKLMKSELQAERNWLLNLIKRATKR
jgi:hypothetical protein